MSVSVTLFSEKPCILYEQTGWQGTSLWVLGRMASFPADRMKSGFWQINYIRHKTLQGDSIVVCLLSARIVKALKPSLRHWWQSWLLLKRLRLLDKLDIDTTYARTITQKSEFWCPSSQEPAVDNGRCAYACQYAFHLAHSRCLLRMRSKLWNTPRKLCLLLSSWLLFSNLRCQHYQCSFRAAVNDEVMHIYVLNLGGLRLGTTEDFRGAPSICEIWFSSVCQRWKHISVC